MSDFVKLVMENVIFVVQFLFIVLAIFLLAYIVEKRVLISSGVKERILNTKSIVFIGLFSALSTVLMLFEIPLFFAPSFYKIDLSEIPVLIITFTLGPTAGVLTEFCKILLKLVFRSSSTAFVGELANFTVGCSLILPASFFYLFNKGKKNALIACAIGTLCMTAFGSAFNAIYLLPKYAQMFGLPIQEFVNMGNAINPAINSVSTFVLFSVVPFNLLKGVVVSVVTLLLYKRLRFIFKS